MSAYKERSREELLALKCTVEAEYEEAKADGLKLHM